MTWIASLADALRDNPVFRRELSTLRRSRQQRVSAAILWALFGLVFFAGLAMEGSAATVAYLLFGAQGLVAALGAISLGSGCVTREREQQTWEALQITRLAPHEILLGKYAAAAIGALVPALPAFPLAFLLATFAWIAHPSRMPDPLRFIVAEAYLVGAALLYLAIALNSSVTSRRTGSAAVGAGGVLALTCGLACSPFGLLFSTDIGAGTYALRTGILLLLVGAGTVAVVAASAASLPGYTFSYTSVLRRSGGLAYLAALALVVILAGSGLSAPDESLRPGLWVHVLVSSIAALVLCCRAEPARVGSRGAFHPLSRACDGALAYCLLLQGIVLIGLLICAGSPSSEVLWAMGISTTSLLMCGGLGCLVASRTRGLEPNIRTAVTLVPAAVLGAAPFCAGMMAGYSDLWQQAVFSLSQTGLIDLLLLPNGVSWTYSVLFGPTGFGGAPAVPLSPALALAVQAAIAAGLLWVALGARKGRPKA